MNDRALEVKFYSTVIQNGVSEETPIFSGIRCIDKQWELLLLKVIQVAIGERAQVTRRLQAGEQFTWVLLVHHKACGTGESTHVRKGSQTACSVTLSSTPVHRQEPSVCSPASIFFYWLSQHLSCLHAVGPLPSPHT